MGTGPGVEADEGGVEMTYFSRPSAATPAPGASAADPWSGRPGEQAVAAGSPGSGDAAAGARHLDAAIVAEPVLRRHAGCAHFPAMSSEPADGTPQAELRRRLRQQGLIAEFGLSALRAPDVDSVLQAATVVAAEGLGIRFAKVLEYLPAENRLLVRAGIGWRAGVVGVAKLEGDLGSPAGYALHTGKPVISNQLAEEARFRTPAVVAEHGIRRAINVIIRGDGEPFGVLEADSPDEGAFSEPDVAFLQALANTLGVAVDRAAAQAEREAMLKEKDLLIAEIHHRVKNSLQLVRNLLTLQARETESGTAREQLLASADRVLSIAAVHEHLYRGGEIGSVAVHDYLAALIEGLRQSSGVAQAGREIVLEAEEARWSADQVPTLGLVMTELVTNALKHGRGDVRVVFVAADEAGLARLTIEDEGPGFTGTAPPGDGQGLGMRLVRAMLQGRGGRLELEQAAGAMRVVACLPPAESRRRR
jgi:two-component sensor histidine kinase